MSRINGERHILFGFVTRKTKHHTLISCTLLLEEAFSYGHALRDIWRLPVKSGEDSAGVRIKTKGRVGKADVADDLPGDVHIANLCTCSNFSGNDYHAGFDECFARHSAIRVLLYQRVEDAVGNLVAHFVRMAL